MGPRKRSKPNPAEGSSSSGHTAEVSSPLRPSPATTSSSTISHVTAGRVPSSISQRDDSSDSKSTTSSKTMNGKKEVRKTTSWYGTWPKKSVASTSVALESIMGGTLKPKASADFSRFRATKEADGADDASISSKPLSKISENNGVGETEVASPDQTLQDTSMQDTSSRARKAGDENNKDLRESDDGKDGKEIMDNKNNAHVREDEPPPLTPAPETAELALRPATSSSWLGWFGRSEVPQDPIATEEPTTAPTVPSEEVDKQPDEPEPAETVAEQTSKTISPTTAAGSSWFGFWQTAAPVEESVKQDAPLSPKKPEEPVAAVDTEDSSQDIVVPATTPTPQAGSTWAFWSRDSSKKPTKDSGSTQQEQGQLAVIGESSETHPARTNELEVKDATVQETPIKATRKADAKNATPITSTPKEAASKRKKRTRPESMDLDAASIRSSSSKAEAAAQPGATASTPTSTKTPPPNLLLPSFKGTYRMKDNPSIIRQIAQLLTRTQQPPAKHVYLSQEPFKVKKALAIGVHGLFPATYLRPMIGQPTGTSIKFANHCAEGIRRWADTHGCEDCEIEKVALEGEGKIGERVENLWKLLLNWIDQIRKADLIILACHSQGVPVTIMLLAKLIELQIITTARIGVCAMAGVSLGPFPDYRSSMGILMGSAAELWEFGNPESDVSKRLETSVRAILNYGARITFVGSIDDQLVPLESAIYTPVHHPHIYRAVFIDGRIHAPDFIAHLVGFAMKLRNLGISDHGLIRELSTPLAGSLVGGEGHSRLYDDEQVYDLAVAHTLETTSGGNVPCEIHKHEGLTQPNPYHLPWIMRGLLEEDFVKTELTQDTAELLRQFDDWKPVNKALKDVKYRLEAVRSKL